MRRLPVLLAVSTVLTACESGSPGVPEPCSLLRRAEVAHATSSEVTSVKNVASIQSRQIRLCSYETTSRFGAITVFVTDSPRPATLARFEHPDENTHPVRGLGDGAYLYAGVTMNVRSGDIYFQLSTQYYQPESRDVLEDLARDGLGRT